MPQPQPQRLSFTPALPVNRQPALSLCGGKKGVDGEVEAREDLARVLFTADTAVRAVAPRQTYVVSGHEQLNVALKSDDRELTEGYEQLIAIVAEHEIITAEARAD